jgi:hypothetical protein
MPLLLTLPAGDDFLGARSQHSTARYPRLHRPVWLLAGHYFKMSPAP